MALPRINKNWVLLGIAVALGIGAVYLSNSLIQRRLAEVEASAHRGEQTMRVVVANRDMQRGDTLTKDDLAVREVPKEWVHSTAILPDGIDPYLQQRLASPLKRGETLIESHLEGKGANVFSSIVRKGWRALSFEVDTVNSVSGMLRPGDRIDLIYTGKSQASTDEVTVPLLSNVSVMATGQTVTRQDEQTGKERTFSTITLEVSPEDADRLIVAKEVGHITAILRHPDDGARNGTRMMDPASLIAGGPNNGQYVEYIVGAGGGIAQSTLAQVAAHKNVH
jgi:pilus assembly protein CpaB